jgi:hypothetical protein
LREKIFSAKKQILILISIEGFGGVLRIREVTLSATFAMDNVRGVSWDEVASDPLARIPVIFMGFVLISSFPQIEVEPTE